MNCIAGACKHLPQIVTLCQWLSQQTFQQEHCTCYPGLQAREQKDQASMPRNGGPENALYYETLEDTIVFDSDMLRAPEDVNFIMR